MALLFFVMGCSEPPPKKKGSAPTQGVVHTPAPQVLEIVVPGSVAGQWKSVKIAVRDQQTGAENIYRVDIGGSFQVPAEQLWVTVEAFLPAFVMDGRQISSTSNQTTNPAALIVIRDEKQVIYSGWLFGLFPDMHAYQHLRYNLTLVGYTPVE